MAIETKQGIQKRRVSLVEFQKKLNEELVGVFDAKTATELNIESVRVEDSESSRLGLLVNSGGIQWFVLLSDLKHVSANANFAPLFLTLSWMPGFTHFRGDVFTVIDWTNLLNRSEHTSSGMEASMLMFDSEADKVALLVDNLNLEYSADYTPLFRYTDESKKWLLNEDISEIDLFLDPKNLNEKEKELIQMLKSNMQKHDAKLFELNFVKDIYIDGRGKRPIFVLHLNDFTNFLHSERPF